MICSWYPALPPLWHQLLVKSISNTNGRLSSRFVSCFVNIRNVHLLCFILCWKKHQFFCLFGKSKRGFLLAAFLLLAFGFVMNMHTCFMGRSRGATRIHSLRELVETVEVAFSVIRVSVTLIYSILVVLHVRNNFSAPVLPLVFSVIVAVFTFKYDGEVSDSSGHADDDLYGDLPVKNIPLIQALPRASNELFPTGMMVASSNPVPLQWHQPLIINSICFRQVYTFHKGRR